MHAIILPAGLPRHSHHRTGTARHEPSSPSCTIILAGLVVIAFGLFWWVGSYSDRDLCQPISHPLSREDAELQRPTSSAQLRARRICG